MNSEPLRDVVSRVFQNIREKNKEGDILNIWKRAVGKRIARHTKPVYFQAGTLVVNVDKSGWLYELNMCKPFLLRKLKRFFLERNLERLSFRLGKV